MLNNIMIMDDTRYADLYSTYSTVRYLNIVIVVNRATGTFKVIKNRFTGKAGVRYHLCYLDRYLEHAKDFQL